MSDRPVDSENAPPSSSSPESSEAPPTSERSSLPPLATADATDGMIPRRHAIIGATVLTLAGVGGGFFGGIQYAKKSPRKKRKPLKRAYIPIEKHTVRHGPEDAKVKIMEFSDFQCPFCGRGNKVIQKVLKEYPKEVAVYFRHQPLKFHKHARGAAIAFQAAARQEKAWELHDKMFANRKSLQSDNLEKFAAEVGLDVARFKKDIEDPALEKEVASDQAAAKKVGVNGTPCFFINGTPIRGAQPFEALDAVVKDEIAKYDAMVKSGTPAEKVYELRSRQPS